MAISSWMLWGRSVRNSRPHRSRQENEEQCVKFDLSKGLKENIKEALTNLYQRQGVSNIKKLAYLNAFVKLVSENESGDFGYNAEQLFCCLRLGLIQEATQVRAAALRAVRYLLRKEQDVLAINKLQYPYFLARSMDINLRNEMERIQALRLVRRILVLAPKHFSPALARSLVSLTNGGIDEKDRGFRAFLATICELGILNSSLLITCGGVSALTRAAMTGQSSSIIEAVVGVLLKLLSSPETRNHVSLFSLATPYCELHSPGLERASEDREQKFSASKHALLSVLRSYPGVLHFCNPNESSGLKSIVKILYVEQLEVRGAVLEFFYELLGLPLPLWTDEPDIALAAIDPNRARENWKLSEGFIAAEGRTILPSLMSHSPNIMELHLALLVYVLLECELHKALVKTIVTSDSFISVRAAVLLGALLHLAHLLLPSEVCDLTPPLPNLLEQASTGSHQALAAVAILSRMHAMMRKRPTPTSLFLDRLLQAGSWLRPTLPRRHRPAIKTWLKRESSTTLLLKEAQVLVSKDVLLWNWPVIRSILHSREESLRILHDSDHRLFIKKLISYFKPSSNQYSRVELGTSATLAREATLACCDLINCLLELPEPEGSKLLNELIGDIAEQIAAIRTSQSAHDCLFSPRHMSTTCCQKYFLFLGQLSHSAKGTVILKGFNLLEKLQDLAISTNHDCYVKLITSSLDYSREGLNRKVMNKIISEASLESTRLYATQFLRLILRAKMTDAIQWAIEILSGRLADSSKAVALAALDALHEACEEPEYLEAFYEQNKDCDQSLTNLGDQGYLLKIRLYSLRAAFSNLSSPAEELEKWIKAGGFAERYVGLIEREIHDCMTRRQRGDNGIYLRRSTNSPLLPRDVFIPPHIISQLVQHELGLQLLMRRNVLQRFARVVQRFRYEFGMNELELNLRNIKGSRSILEDSYLVSEESGTDEAPESNRLETIIDSEVMEVSETHTPQKADSLVEIRRKLSLDESRRTTPERSWKTEVEIRDENHISFEGRLMKVKAALWVLGHAGTSAEGVEQLKNLGIIEMLTLMAETCPHYAVRATAMYSLSLISTNRAGADVLLAFDWPCVRYKRGEEWPVVPQNNPYTAPSPVPVQRHHRSLSDGKPDFPEPVIRRSRNRSESAATELEVRKFILPERGETPSPVSSVQRLSQQDAEGYARLRSIQRARIPSYSQSSLEMYSSDGRHSLQSLSEFEFTRSWFNESILSSTPPPLPPPPLEDDDNAYYMGICLPRKLTAIFPPSANPLSAVRLDERLKINADPSGTDEESSSEYDISGDHNRVCLICYCGTSNVKESATNSDSKLRRDILRHVQRLANPVLYKHSQQTLLRLRQRYPEKFQDTCLFSEVAARLGSNTYRIPARRFLQELFLDSSFDALYKEPAEILNISLDIERKSVPTSPSDDSRVLVKPSETKINGRVTPSCLQNDPLSAVQEEATGQPRIVYSQNKKALLIPERMSDEKIIAEILKPEERIRVAKSSDKIIKVTGTNTAISLE